MGGVEDCSWPDSALQQRLKKHAGVILLRTTQGQPQITDPLFPSACAMVVQPPGQAAPNVIEDQEE